MADFLEVDDRLQDFEKGIKALKFENYYPFSPISIIILDNFDVQFVFDNFIKNGPVQYDGVTGPVTSGEPWSITDCIVYRMLKQ